LATGLLIFLAGLPISVYAARYGLDMDWLTQGAGFGYLGSTLTSLISASFTFIFFALEAAVMAYALELAFDLPPKWGYMICALGVLPLVTYGVTHISRLEAWTQPPEALSGLWAYPGEDSQHLGFSLPAFGGAMTVGVALITQIGEQGD
jgi:purine-cytosine permease-like protein